MKNYRPITVRGFLRIAFAGLVLSGLLAACLFVAASVSSAP